MITGTINVAMTLEKANYLNELEARDVAMPIKLHKYSIKKDDGTEYAPSELCPICGRTVTYVDGTFCPTCGQRLDRENSAL